MLNESSTVEEFNARMESRCSPGNNDSEKTDWLGREFTKAKEQIASGC
jgi:hypothetical protein